MVLGNGTVGKTSLIMRFCEDYFAKSYKQTIGVDFFVKRLELPGDIHITLQVWDIGGQSIFSKMIQTYIFEANAVSINNYHINVIWRKTPTLTSLFFSLSGGLHI